MAIEINERLENERRAFWQGYTNALTLAQENPHSIETLWAIIPPQYRPIDPTQEK